MIRTFKKWPYKVKFLSTSLLTLIAKVTGQKCGTNSGPEEKYLGPNAWGHFFLKKYTTGLFPHIEKKDKRNTCLYM